MVFWYGGKYTLQSVARKSVDFKRGLSPLVSTALTVNLSLAIILGRKEGGTHGCLLQAAAWDLLHGLVVTVLHGVFGGSFLIKFIRDGLSVSF